MPGAKPADYEYRGRLFTHYLNHGNSWQTCRADQPAVAIRDAVTTPPEEPS